MARTSRKVAEQKIAPAQPPKVFQYAPRNCDPTKQFAFRFEDDKAIAKTIVQRGGTGNVTAFKAQLELDLRLVEGRTLAPKPRRWPQETCRREIEARGAGVLAEEHVWHRPKTLQFVYRSMGGEILVAEMGGLSEAEYNACAELSLWGQVTWGSAINPYRDCRRVEWPSEYYRKERARARTEVLKAEMEKNV